MNKLYIASSGPFHKVGFSYNPIRRVSSMQIGNPVKIVLEGYFDIADSMVSRCESAAHRLLKARKVDHCAEWFSCTLQEAIKYTKLAVDKEHEHYRSNPMGSRPVFIKMGSTA